jgi:hypothetical protein
MDLHNLTVPEVEDEGQILLLLPKVNPAPGSQGKIIYNVVFPSLLEVPHNVQNDYTTVL